MDPITKIKSNFSNFTKSEFEIANFIIDNPHLVIEIAIERLADYSNTSKSAIIRFCQKLGYNGFSEFKFNMSTYLDTQSSLDDNKTFNPISSITSLYCNQINLINENITIDDLNTISNIISSSRKIKVLGLSRTGLTAINFKLRLLKNGIDSDAITDYSYMGMLDSHILNANDLCIIFSITCSSSRYKDCIETINKTGCKKILITMNPKAILRKYFDKVVVLPNISKLSSFSYLDDQSIFLIFNEILLSQLSLIKNKEAMAE